jgi:hypothetical protein
MQGFFLPLGSSAESYIIRHVPPERAYSQVLVQKVGIIKKQVESFLDPFSDLNS